MIIETMKQNLINFNYAILCDFRVLCLDLKQWVEHKLQSIFLIDNYKF